MSRGNFLRLACLLAIALTSVSNQAAQPGRFTLEQVMSSPFPEGLVAARGHGRVAWVFNLLGVRNLWMAEPSGSDYHARQVTAYTEDDGQEIGNVSWTPDSESIVYARGGDFENGHEYPNPRSFPQGVEQDVWVIAASGGAPRRLAEGHSPAVSPKGDQVAFIFKDQVWSAKIDGSEKASQLIHSKGGTGSLRWSPDGARLAFLSTRGDHSFIGVYDFGDKSVRYLDASLDRDGLPVWSPDSKKVAFLRFPASREAFAFGPKREAEPWLIRVADATTGIGREVWRAEKGRGSAFHGMVADNQLLWGAGDRLVFPWERDGWLHLYAVPVQGGTAALLTPGEFEVEDAALTTDSREVIYSSNQDDVDRRHLWRVSVEGGRLQAVTRGNGLEWSPVMASDGRTIALFRSDARRPARVAALAGAGEPRDLAPGTIPSDFPDKDLVEPKQVILSAADGMRIHGQLFMPAGARAGELHPAVVFFHGGSRRQMLLGWHYMFYYHNAYALNQYLASRGYVVLSVNYRSGIGYGMEFREALNYGATGASEFNDVLGAGLYLRSRTDVDPRRIGLWGGSYGGYLTALGLARASDLFAAGVDFHGVHDWNIVIHNFVPAYDPQANPDAARRAFESSPLASVKTWRSPVLLIHGDDDRNVPFSESVHLAEALRKQGVAVELLVFPDEIHDFLTHRRWVEAYHAAADFLDMRLQASR